jgi:flagellar biosynthetic protein FliR
MTINILPEVTVLFLLLFARLGALVMLMPALGEQAIPTRVRLSFALVLTLVFYPTISASLPQGLANDTPALIFAMVTEVLIGLAFGLISRLLLSVTQVAGASIAANMGLGFSQTLDPTMGQQGAIVGSFLGVTGMMLIFASNLHHVAIAGIAGSYAMFPPGEMLPVADFRDAAVMTIAESFKIGIQISAPFIVFGLIFNLGLGVLGKLMPQLQAYFLALPVSIFVGLILLALLTGTILTWYLNHVQAGLMRLVAG